MKRKQPPTKAKATPKPKNPKNPKNPETESLPITREDLVNFGAAAELLTENIINFGITSKALNDNLQNLSNYIGQLHKHFQAQRKEDLDNFGRVIELTLVPFREVVDRITQEANRSAIAEGSMKADNKATIERIAKMEAAITNQSNQIHNIIG